MSFAVALWIAALTAPALLAADAVEPGLALTIVTGANQVIRSTMLVALVLAAVGLLAYPPFLPALRLWGRQLRARMLVDQGPLHNAMGRLEHHETADDHFTVAQIADRTGDAKRALEHLQRAIAHDPASSKSRHLLGRIALRHGQVEAAAAQFAAVVQRDPEFAFGDAMLGLGTALEMLGRDDEARAALERHERTHGGNRDALRIRARIAKRAGRLDEARELLRRAASPLEATERNSPEAALARARARVALWRTGGSR